MKMRRRKIKKTRQNQTANHLIERNHLQRTKKKAQTKRRMLAQKKVRSQVPIKRKKRNLDGFPKRRRSKRKTSQLSTLILFLSSKTLTLK